MMKKNKKISLSILFAIIAILLTVDMISDLKAGEGLNHMIEEILIMILIFVGISFIWIENFKLRLNLVQTQNELERIKLESKQWKENHRVAIESVSTAIDQQMSDWSLTTSEKEIARLLIKGLSMKEIAELRNTSEKTVRQQSQSIYTKSKLPGRSGLAAFFLENLLTP